MQRNLQNSLVEGVILIKIQVACAIQSASNNSANISKQEKETGPPLVTTFQPSLKDLNSLTKMNLQHIYADQEVKKAFTPALFVSFKIQ